MLCAELDLRRVRYERDVPVAVRYKGRALDCAYRLDIIVAEKVVVELKAVERLHPISQAQMLTYLRLKRLRLGLLINFNCATLQEGIRRIINSR